MELYLLFKLDNGEGRRIPEGWLLLFIQTFVCIYQVGMWNILKLMRMSEYLAINIPQKNNE